VDCYVSRRHTTQLGGHLGSPMDKWRAGELASLLTGLPSERQARETPDRHRDRDREEATKMGPLFSRTARNAHFCFRLWPASSALQRGAS